MVLLREDRRCKNCVAYNPDTTECRATPVFQTRQADEWCLQFMTWVEQDHPGADPTDNWKLQAIFTPEDEKDVTNPLDRDVVISKEA